MLLIYHVQHVGKHDDIHQQARSQVEARKPGLQHHMGLDARNHDLLLVNNKGADQLAHPPSLISTFVIHFQKSKIIFEGFNMKKSLARP